MTFLPSVSCSSEKSLRFSWAFLHTHGHTIPQLHVLIPRRRNNISFVLPNPRRETSSKPSNSPVEPVGISFVTPVAFCHSQITQSHQGPLDSSHVLSCGHATVSHEQSAQQTQGGAVTCALFSSPLNTESIVVNLQNSPVIISVQLVVLPSKRSTV